MINPLGTRFLIPYTDYLGYTIFGVYSISSKGEVHARHNIHCEDCNSGGTAWVNMSLVKEDYIFELSCPICGYETLIVTTFRGIENSET